MRIIRPITINDAALTSSNVPENDYAAYNAGTTYALGDRALYIVANKHWIIESLQAGNIGHTPTGVSTDTWWLLVGYDNRWKMFDGSVTSQTAMASVIDTVFATLGRIDSVALLNISAATARVKMTDAIDGIVFDQTFSLISTMGIGDWYAYFYEPIVRLQDFSTSDMPAYNAPTIEVILSDSGNTVLCGACILGLNRELGGTQYGLKLGIQDYSIKQRDDFGNYTILERAFNKYAQAQIIVDAALVDQLEIILAGYRATPIVYIGADDYGSSIIYGFYKDFSVLIAYPTHSICSIELEGLT
jgi:hypothetical protein